MSALLVAIAVVVATLQTGGVEIVEKGSQSNVDDARQAVAFTEAEFATLWRQHDFEKPAPKVDFKTRTVVAIFLGSRPTAGYDVEIVGTRQEGNTLIVEWAEVTPKERMLLAQVLTSPALIASIPKTAGTVGFRKVTR